MYTCTPKLNTVFFRFPTNHLHNVLICCFACVTIDSNKKGKKNKRKPSEKEKKKLKIGKMHTKFIHFGNLRVLFQAGPMLDVLSHAEAIPFPRLGTDRMKAANNSNRQNPEWNGKTEKATTMNNHEQMNIIYIDVTHLQITRWIGHQ